MDTVVYFGARIADFGLHERAGVTRAEDAALRYAARGPGGAELPRRIVPIDDAARALSYLQLRPVDVLVLDARTEGELARARSLLAALYPHGRMSGPLLRKRIFGLVSEGASGADAAFALGQESLGGVLVAPDGPALLARIDSVLSSRAHGKIAICLAGGGIEGLLYELGVLRALQSYLPNHSVVDFDLFCGISAGAILGSLLANGIGPDEILRALEGRSARLDAITRLDLFEPNLGELGERALRLALELMRGGAGPRGAITSLARAVPTAAFSGRRLGRWLERQLARPGMADRFADLRRPLYVGATDQDTSKAVVFGDGPFADVPVSRAVRASTALVPFYPSVEVRGRHYIDGAFSRTTNMRVAAQKGATLVLLVDPLVPVRSAEPGYVRARGGIFAAAQGLKALINGRFDKAVSAIQELHPDVAFHLFRPEGDEMRVLSGSPMKYFYRREVEEIAYRTTLEKLRVAFPRLSRDFALHGVELVEPKRASVRPPPLVPGLEPSALGIG